MKMKKNAIKFYQTTDLALISVLQLLGYPIQKTERNESGRVTFFIKNDSKLEQIIQDFWSRKLKVEPLAYFESIKATKSRIYQ